jgi:hypothetical protein
MRGALETLVARDDRKRRDRSRRRAQDEMEQPAQPRRADHEREARQHHGYFTVDARAAISPLSIERAPLR